MKTNIIKKVVVIICFVVTMTLVSSFAYAASSLSIAAGSTSLTVGSSTTLTIRANNVTGRINITSSNPGVISLSSSSEWVENGSVTVRATAKAAGSAYITVSSADTSDSTTGETVNVSTGVNLNSKEIVIDTRSSNNYLSSLSVDGYELSPAFNANTNNYTLSVGHEVPSLNVSAIPADNKSRTVVDGNLDLVAGENNVTVTVTAENGYKRVYTIVVTKEKNPDDVDTTVTSLSINNAILKGEFNPDVYEYMCDDITADVKSLDIDLVTKILDLKYEVVGNDDLKQGINHITIKITSRDGSVTKEYKIIVYKTDEVLALEETEPTIAEVENENVLLTKVKEYKYEILLGLGVIVVFSIIIVLIIVLKKNKKEDDEIEKAEVVEKQIEENKNVDTIESITNEELEQFEDIVTEVVEEQETVDDMIEELKLDLPNLKEDVVVGTTEEVAEEKEVKVRKGSLLSNIKKEKNKKSEVVEEVDDTKINIDLSEINDKE